MNIATISVKNALLVVTALAMAVLATFALSQTKPADATGFGNKTIVGINKNLSTAPNAVGFVFNDPFYNLNDQVIGSDSGACEALPPRDGITDEYKCDTVFTFSNGTVSATGIQRLSATTAVGPVTGGTGAYEGCEGTVTGELYTATPEPQDFKITLKLSECW